MKHTESDEVKDIRWSNFRRIFHEKYMSERLFDKKVKEFDELKMSSMSMDSFINRFLIVIRKNH